MAIKEARLELVIFSAATLVLIGVLGWVGATLVEAGKQQAAQGQQLLSLEQKVESISQSLVSGTANRYTGADAARDRESMMSLIQSIIDFNNIQATKIAELINFKARVEERLKISTP